MLGQVMFGTRTSSARFLVVLAAFLTVNLLGVGCALGDLQIAGYEDRLHDRFYVGADNAFIGTGYNWSGVGRLADPAGTSHNWKFATMISDNYFITADHFKPNRADDPAGAPPKVRFYRTADPNGEYWESTIALSGNKYVGTQIGSTDLWVGKLASTPPGWVMRYPLAKRHEATNYLSYTENDLFIFGQDSPRSLTSTRVGRNEINSVNSAGDFQWSYDPAVGFGPDEAQTVSGDSGGPSFLTIGAVPVLAGIHTRTNFDTGVSANLQQILNAVNEPISLSTGLLGDVNGDYHVSPLDMYAILRNYRQTQGATYHQGDLTGDGRVNYTDLYLWSLQRDKSLFAPTDFDRDGDVDGSDLAILASRWQRTIGIPYEIGDANGDAIVDYADLEIFDRNQNRAYFGPLPAPLSSITGDLNGDGIVNDFDLNIVGANINRQVTPGTNGDVNRNGIVDAADLGIVSDALGDSFGDINGDHEVGPADFVILANNWNRVVTGGRLSGDMNGDGRVNALDALVLFDWWGMRGGTFGDIHVPEPGSAALALLAAVALAGARRRRK